MDVPDEAIAAADVSTDAMAAAALPPIVVDMEQRMEQRQGITRPVDDARTRTAARFLGAGALDGVSQQKHLQSRGWRTCGKGGIFHDEQDSSSA